MEYKIPLKPVTSKIYDVLEVCSGWTKNMGGFVLKKLTLLSEPDPQASAK